ncbi:hypothetical protein GUITHDRAFT_83788 [Guillardia theta CCMP2712]|uniref:EamA domain-containing protein n=1 Tax=Guillardia theta (strain CCMP2712) TaxID=905079 RepID=L1K4J5_GUITC|nr:hypothetical protein GUITHDRAFT_83788 [Guillardia theta CCMP2712]EKX55529.1 hypothetical protein GUITHDRAFT_83788 [Guillardia theta CCMP2712]|eukprot:XP_005842509.1 hypothetical protein GUITHDRAFT_83788 [Guillardia theta CCMP2712]
MPTTSWVLLSFTLVSTASAFHVPQSTLGLPCLRQRGDSVCSLKMQRKEEQRSLLDRRKMRSRAIGRDLYTPLSFLPQVSEQARGSTGKTKKKEESIPETLAKMVEDFSTSLDVGTARAWLLFIVALSGINFGAIKVLDGGFFDGSSILAVRFIIAAAVLSPWLFRAKKEIIVPSIETGAWLAGGYFVQSVSLTGGTDSGVAAFFASMTTVICPFLEATTGIRLERRAWAAAFLAVCGAACLELGGGSLPTGADFWGILQPFLFGLYLFKTERTVHENPSQALEITSIQTLVTAVMSCAVAAVGHWDLLHADVGAVLPSLQECLALLWMGIMSSAFVLGMETVVVGKLSSSETALMFSTEPLWAAAFGSMFIGESFGWNTAVGGALAITACLTRSLDRNAVRVLSVKLRSVPRAMRKAFSS